MNRRNLRCRILAVKQHPAVQDIPLLNLEISQVETIQIWLVSLSFLVHQIYQKVYQKVQSYYYYFFLQINIGRQFHFNLLIITIFFLRSFHMIFAVHQKPKFHFQISLYHSVRYVENRKRQIKRFTREGDTFYCNKVINDTVRCLCNDTF